VNRGAQRAFVRASRPRSTEEPRCPTASSAAGVRLIGYAPDSQRFSASSAERRRQHTNRAPAPPADGSVERRRQQIATRDARGREQEDQQRVETSAEMVDEPEPAVDYIATRSAFPHSRSSA